MRDILFKAKRLDNGEWVEGYVGYKGKGTEFEECHIMQSRFSVTASTFAYPFYFVDIQVNKETVCQYTGLTDKNGVKIFEGDKLANKYGETGIVEYGVENCGCCYDVYGFAVAGLEKWIDKDLLVIGNIHDKE